MIDQPNRRVFLSYRRADSANVSDRIYATLVEQFGREAVFKDVDSIPLGADFRAVIGNAVGSCDVFLAVIGRDWVDAKNEIGELRLENPDDFVRLEIEAAISREIPIIPLLVRGAEIPSENELPSSLESIRFRNAAKVRPDPDFSTDIHRLASAIANILGVELSQTQVKRNNIGASLDEWFFSKVKILWHWLPKKLLACLSIAIIPGELSFLSAQIPSEEETLLLVFSGVGIALFSSTVALGWHLLSRLKRVEQKFIGSLSFIVASVVGLVWAIMRVVEAYQLGWWTHDAGWW